MQHQEEDPEEADGLTRTTDDSTTSLTPTDTKSGGYTSVTSSQDDWEDGIHQPYAATSNSPWEQRWFEAWTPDDPGYYLSQVFASSIVVKLFKFLLFTVFGIMISFYIVRLMVRGLGGIWTDFCACTDPVCSPFYQSFEHDEKYTLSDMMTYELQLILSDAVLFFLVGRLFDKPGVDHGSFLFWSAMANIYSSSITTFTFLQHSFTLYEMHCTWPWKLWGFVVVVAVLVVALVLLHVRQAVFIERHVIQKVSELLLAFMCFLAPVVTSKYFHFHHWFAGWLIGMHCNYKTWWSRAAMAWCWGCYINGIAVYGRDPILTCQYGMYLSDSLGCPYLHCYREGIKHYTNDPHNNHTIVKPMIPPDWRNCSADQYHT